MQVIRGHDLKSRPWKNGQGVTTEIAIHPQGAQLDDLDFSWRISRAEIRSDGPFSKFPGYNRWLVVLGPDSLTLNGVHREKLVPFQFAGDEATDARLVGEAGLTCDLGLIFRRDFPCEMRVVEVVESKPHSFLIPHLVSSVCLYICGENGVTVMGQRLSPGDSMIFSVPEVPSNSIELSSHGHTTVAVFLISTSTVTER
jgi:uncharacterized protein